jgi:5-hydroxyisourate hydrolase
MNRISTHVLDLAAGKPASGVSVQLARQQSQGDWHLVASSTTDLEGRCPQLLKDGELIPGLYRLRFETESYFAARRVETLYPFIEVCFQVRPGESHFHIPLLLNATGYTTYRGV